MAHHFASRAPRAEVGRRRQHEGSLSQLGRAAARGIAKPAGTLVACHLGRPRGPMGPKERGPKKLRKRPRPRKPPRHLRTPRCL
eukprot:648426-Pyramimonas_sp.AAC.1